MSSLIGGRKQVSTNVTLMYREQGEYKFIHCIGVTFVQKVKKFPNLVAFCLLTL